jgi:hypothetical protein
MKVIAAQAMNTWASGLFGSKLLKFGTFQGFRLVGGGLLSDGEGRFGGHLMLGYQKSVSAESTSTVSAGAKAFKSYRIPVVREAEAGGG